MIHSKSRYIKKGKSLLLFVISVIMIILVLPSESLSTSYQTQDGQDELSQKITDNFYVPVNERLVNIDFIDAPLQIVLREFSRQAGISFSIQSEIAWKKSITYTCDNKNVLEALVDVLYGSGLSAEISDNQRVIIIKEQPKPQESVQQEVSGRVTDAETGDSLPGVNVVIEGTDRGTSTDADGTFQIAVTTLEESLIFSYIGYQLQIIPINGRTNIDVALQTEIMAGEELVVTAFGIQREARGLTYSTQSVRTETMSEARELNPVNALQGKVAGLSITQGGQGIGSPSRVILRGERSFRGNSQPLYVVDGVPASMDAVSPDDIVSIDVMKGPNAAALYGSAAQNGAIIITTRQAEEDQANFSLSNTFTLENALDHHNYQNEFGQGSGGVYSRDSEFSYGPRMEGQMVDHWSPADGLAGSQYAFNAQPNNNRDFFQSGYSSASNITGSIGGERTQSLFSYTFTDAQGVVPGNELRRHNVSLRVSSQLTDRLSLDSRLSYIMQNIDNELGFGQQISNSMRHVYRLPRNIRTEDIKMFEYIDQNDQPRQHYWDPSSNGGSNPYWTNNRVLNNRETERVSTFASLKYDFSEVLSLMVRGSVNAGHSDWSERMYNDTYVLAQNGYYSLQSSKSRQMDGDFLLSVNQDFLDDWSVNASFGGSINSHRNSSLSSNTGIGGSGALIVPNLFSLGNAQNVNSSYSIGSPSDLQSLYAFSQIGWRDILYLDLTGRNDWSSTLPAHNRSYFYPSIGLSAIVNDLVSLPGAISLAKVRASWAKVGSSAPAFHFSRSASVFAGGTDGFLSLDNTLPNPDLKPEETESIELGLDVRLFGGRLGVDLTAYQSNTRNQLFGINTPVGSGASLVFTNAGDVENRGIEFLFSGIPVQTRGFMWNIDLNYAKNQSMVKEVHSDQDELQLAGGTILNYRIEKGKPFGVLYGRGWQRDDQDRVLIGSDGMPRITPGFDVPVADFNPDFTAGITNTFTYRNLSLSFLIDHRQGGSFVSYTNAILYFDGVTAETLKGRDGTLVFGENFFSHETAIKEADNSPNDIQIDAESFWRGVGGRTAPIAEPFVEEATNTRLRELTIGYNLPQSMLTRLPLTNLKISLVGRNLFFIYKAAEGADPEYMVSTAVTRQGQHEFAPPTTRSFGANVKIDF